MSDADVIARGTNFATRLAAGVAGGLLTLIGLLLGEVVLVAGYMLLAFGVVTMVAAILLRRRGFELRRDGVLLTHGGRTFGERELVPWRDVARLDIDPTNDSDAGLVSYVRHNSEDAVRLPGVVRELRPVVERLHAEVGPHHPRLGLPQLPAAPTPPLAVAANDQ